jgi:aldose 1-epimerase
MSGSTRRRAALALLLGFALAGLGGVQTGCASNDEKSAAPAAASATRQDATPGEGMTKAGITRSDFGKTQDGAAAHLFTLTNKNGLVVKITDYGGIVTEIQAPDRDGKLDNVVLGFDSLDNYLAGHPFFGAIAGRYANRIAKGKFTLDGKEYTLATNNGPNHLHGGAVGFDKRIWQAEPVESATAPGLKLTYTSKDGEEGYPGNLTATVTYTLTDKNALDIRYEATTDKPTVLNLTNHSYFNLHGRESGRDVKDHVFVIHADRYTAVDDTLIPTGELAAVKGTPLDFTKPTAVGDRIEQVGKDPTGYDHNYVLNMPRPGVVALAVQVLDPDTGRAMEVLTDQPGVQLYTGNFLDGKLSSPGGKPYVKHYGFCLETQHFPDSPNHDKFPTTVLRPGETFRSRTMYVFTTDKPRQLRGAAGGAAN